MSTDRPKPTRSYRQRNFRIQPEVERVLDALSAVLELPATTVVEVALLELGRSLLAKEKADAPA